MITVERHGAIAPLAGEWDALADRARAAPFLRPGWTAAWAAAFAGGRVELLAARRDGRLCGVLPTVRRAGAAWSAVNGHSPGGELLAEDGAAARALLASLLARRPRAVVLTRLTAGGPTRAAAWTAARAAGFRITERPTVPAPYLDLGRPPDGRRRFLADLRRRRRRLQELGAVADALDGTLAELVALEADGWKGARGSAIASRPSTARFYRDMLVWATGRDLARVFALRLDGRAVAVLLALEEHGVLYLLKTGYDPALARCSPGRLVLEAAIAHAARSGLRRVELGGGTESYKMEWTGTVHERVALQCYAPGVLGDLAWVAAAHGRPLAQRAGLDRLLAPRRDRLLAMYDTVRGPVRRRAR